MEAIQGHWNGIPSKLSTITRYITAVCKGSARLDRNPEIITLCLCFTGLVACTGMSLPLDLTSFIRVDMIWKTHSVYFT